MKKILVPLVALGVPFAASAAPMSPLIYLSAAEQSYYEQIFNYVMDNTDPNASYEWASYNGKGSFTPEALYESNSGATCRNFSETFVVRGRQGAAKGVACKRKGTAGWCQLGLYDALTCAMERPSSLLTKQFGGGSGLLVTMPDANLPKVTAPGIDADMDMGIKAPDVNMPEVDAPQVEMPKSDAKGVADNVTGSAGRAAGSAVGGAKDLFIDTFLK